MESKKLVDDLTEAFIRKHGIVHSDFSEIEDRVLVAMVRSFDKQAIKEAYAGQSHQYVIFDEAFDISSYIYAPREHGPEDPNPKSVYHTQPIPNPDPFSKAVSSPGKAKRLKARAKRKRKSR